jgi:hypothetical protein
MAPHPLQFSPQPSATDSQAWLNASTARISAEAGVSQGDHAQIRRSANEIKPMKENFRSMINPFSQVTL